MLQVQPPYAQAGGSIGASRPDSACVAKPGDIIVAGSQLDSTVGQLESLVERLEQRTQSAVLPSPAPKDEAKSPEPVRSGVAQAMHNLDLRVLTCCQRLRYLVDNIQL